MAKYLAKSRIGLASQTLKPGQEVPEGALSDTMVAALLKSGSIAEVAVDKEQEARDAAAKAEQEALKKAEQEAADKAEQEARDAVAKAEQDATEKPAAKTTTRKSASK